MLDLIEHATGQGWTLGRACAVLELNRVRAYRWLERRRSDRLGDGKPGAAVHGLLACEVEEIIGLFHEWGEVDRSHRKLAHRGSYLNRVWVSPSSVRRVLAAHELHLRRPKRPGRSQRKPFPDWAQWKPKQIWIFGSTDRPAYVRASRTTC